LLYQLSQSGLEVQKRVQKYCFFLIYANFFAIILHMWYNFCTFATETVQNT